MVNKDTKEALKIEFNGAGNSVANTDKSVANTDKSVAEKALFVQERYNISNVAYHELVLTCLVSQH